jgi:hypothetical protein
MIEGAVSEKIFKELGADEDKVDAGQNALDGYGLVKDGTKAVLGFK